ncbi:spermatogenesis-associated protein 6 [Cylas formicarius]|uniref:spermatogenesis-associated protein 6 n=1 Tax=Cylas formicarius TaxID=197179 RepID=UPI002958A584|nr:spermatogenesis-associated protein 6 [Cylas formicarius]
MSKEFLVKVELCLKKITCPGVWLCSNGKVSLQLFMLDSSIQTELNKPYFPIRFNEKFIFRKIFDQERRLTELHRTLNDHWFYAELVQWKTCNEGYILAFFYTTLDDLLYPSAFRTYTSGTNLDLLMEPTKLFPGTISPKLELCTKTTIEEIFSEANGLEKSSTLTLIGPQAKRNHPRAVCHNKEYSRLQQHSQLSTKSRKPIFKYTKPADEFPPISEDSYMGTFRKRESKLSEDNLRRKKNVTVDTTMEQPTCYCGCRPISLKSGVSILKNKNSDQQSWISHKSLSKCSCQTCSQYDCYFYQSKDMNHASSAIKGHYCSYCPNSQRKFHISHDDSPCKSEISSKKNMCCCLPQRKSKMLVKQLHEKIQDSINGISSLGQYVDCKRCNDSD